MEPLTTFTATIVALPIENIDTDQIIPARFLKTTDKAGLGDRLFADWRYAADGSQRPDFVLNRPDVRGAGVLVAGHNFGCGSSREHAPWALLGAGFRAVISTSFADIFRGNALKHSLLPIVVPADKHKALLAAVGADPAVEVTVDLENQALTLPDGSSVTFPIDDFAKHCMLQGVDELGYILQLEPQIAAYESKRTLSINTLAEV